MQKAEEEDNRAQIVIKTQFCEVKIYERVEFENFNIAVRVTFVDMRY